MRNLQTSVNRSIIQRVSKHWGDKLERFANTSEGRRGRGIAFLDTWKHKRKPGSGPDSNIVPECKSWFTPSLALVLIPMQPRGRQPASRCQPSTIIPSWCKPAERLRGRLSRSNSALEEISSPPRYLDEPRRIRIPSW